MEFTGLHQSTTPISIGCVVMESTASFYGEFTDYALDQVDDWLRDHVLINLRYFRIHGDPTQIWHTGAFQDAWRVSGDRTAIREGLHRWLKELSETSGEQIEVWGDCLAYDWVLFCNLWGGALNLPPFIYYIPFDLATLFKLKGVDPDISRLEFSGSKATIEHDAMQDASLIYLCYDKLMGDGNGNGNGDGSRI